MVNRLGATSIELTAHAEASRLQISLSYDSSSVDPVGKEQASEFATLLHQIATLQGTFKVIPRISHGASWEIEIPTAGARQGRPLSHQ
jgi:hypothetical protein